MSDRPAGASPSAPLRRRVARPSGPLCRLAAAALAGWMSALAPALAIVGTGTGAPDLDPYVVMLLNRSGDSAGFCSAIVVAADALLTAAHCVPLGADVRGYTGSAALHEVAAIERSPDFRADAIRSRQRSIDLALVRLAVPLPARYRPAALAEAPEHAPGTPFRIAGFGVGREGVATSSGKLRSATVVAHPPRSDVLLWATGQAGSASGACTGDSGGPVLAGDAVVAVIAWSAGEGGRRCGALTQAVWIGPQRGWIDGILQRWGKR